jgi:hypothetical protein
MRISHLATTLLIGMLPVVGAFNIGPADASPGEQVADLTGKASVSVTFTGRDNFNSEYRYDLTVRNRSSDPLIADSLIIVLEKITNLAGEDREPLKSEPARTAKRMTANRFFACRLAPALIWLP